MPPHTNEAIVRCVGRISTLPTRCSTSQGQYMRNILIGTLIFMIPAISAGQGQGSGRAQDWDFSVAGIYQRPDIASGQSGSSLDVDDAWGLGFNLGYNFSNRLSVSADIDFLRPDYKATLVDENYPGNTTTVNHSMSQFNGRLKGTFNFTDGPFVPYIEAGFGWTYIDSNLADGPPITGCWWHPWWGYICSNYYSTFSKTYTSYGAGIGLLYEMVGNSFIKASYNYWTLDTGSQSADPALETLQIEYGWRF